MVFNIWFHCLNRRLWRRWSTSAHRSVVVANRSRGDPKPAGSSPIWSLNVSRRDCWKVHSEITTWVSALRRFQVSLTIKRVFKYLTVRLIPSTSDISPFNGALLFLDSMRSRQDVPWWQRVDVARMSTPVRPVPAAWPTNSHVNTEVDTALEWSQFEDVSRNLTPSSV